MTTANPSGYIATLPAGAQPAQNIAVPLAVANGTTVGIFIDTSGGMNFVNTVPAGWVSFNGLCFQTAK